jgi:hypothetical protein
MGFELYRMIRDGAPASWTAPMRLVAAAVADDAHDPRQPGSDDDGGLPWSVITIRGEFRRGKWHDGLAQRTGLSERSISRALTDLARAGYEMREETATDKRGRPVFAYPGHRLRFRVPPLKPRDEPIDVPGGRSPDTSTTRSPDSSTIRSPDTSTMSPPKVARNGAEGRQDRPDRSPDPATQSPLVPPLSNPPPHPQVLNRSLEGVRDGQTDDDSETRSRPPNGYGWCPVCGNRYRVREDGRLQDHGPRHHRCKGSRQPPETEPHGIQPAEPGDDDQADDDEYPF